MVQETSSLKNIALTLFIFGFKQFSGVQVLRSLQFVIVSDAVKGKANRCETLKSDSRLPKNFIIIRFSDNPSKIMKNAFYFILKALFVLKIFTFLYWLFGHLEKMA